MSAPLEKISQFLKAVKSKHYDAALQLSNDILTFEPNNSVILAYRPYLNQMVEDKQKEENGNESVESEDEETDEGENNESDEETDEGEP